MWNNRRQQGAAQNSRSTVPYLCDRRTSELDLTSEVVASENLQTMSYSCVPTNASMFFLPRKPAACFWYRVGCRN